LLNRNGIRKSFLNQLSLNASTQSKIKIFSANESNLIQENISSATEVLKEFIDLKSIQKIFKTLPSVRRRFEYVYKSNSLDVIDDFAHHPTAISKTLKLAQQRYQDLVLVLEIGSNSMKSGTHDVKLLEVLKDTKTFLVNASKEQISKFNETAEKATLEKLIKICGERTKKKRAILFCGNKNFNRLQENLINHLISDST
jgi:UDP-N-acetylmuramate: L-alanyl-gamma-D-glutamyl-meso-diaminopimelate ligase